MHSLESTFWKPVSYTTTCSDYFLLIADMCVQCVHRYVLGKSSHTEPYNPTWKYALTCCIFKISHRVQHVPFRESKLTHYFQSFFTGKGKICMIINISQSCSAYDETLNVLKFSTTAQRVSVFRFVLNNDHLTALTACLGRADVWVLFCLLCLFFSFLR